VTTNYQRLDDSLISNGHRELFYFTFVKRAPRLKRTWHNAIDGDPQPVAFSARFRPRFRGAGNQRA
jgi:hypothetical protein